MDPYLNQVNTNLEFVPVDGTIGWSAAVGFAAKRRARLPLKRELDAYLVKYGFVPLFDNDQWVPVADSLGGWVAVGNLKAGLRLGKTHMEIDGAIPPWSEMTTFIAERSYIALIRCG